MLRKSQYKDMDRWSMTAYRQKHRYYDRTANAPNKNVRWSQQEQDIIMKHEMTDNEIAKLIGRSVRSIQVKRSKLNKVVDDFDVTTIELQEVMKV